MLSTLFFIENNAIYYRTKDFINGNSIPFIDFDYNFPAPEEGKLYSHPLRSLMHYNKHSPSQAYHYAGLVLNKHPEINWALEDQLLDFEKRLRYERYLEEYLVKEGITCYPNFGSDWAMIDFEMDFARYQQGFEPDEMLITRVKEKLAFWTNNTKVLIDYFNPKQK